MDQFCRELPKVELHAHLNGSLSRATITELKRYHADAGLVDTTNTFIDDLQVGAGDSTTLLTCFEVFTIVQNLTSTPEALSLATSLTLQEYQDDGCCYLELRSTPRDTTYMTKRQYVDTIVKAIQKSSRYLTIKSKLIISLDRKFNADVADEITELAIEYYKTYPDVVVGIELSGNPTINRFSDFKAVFEKARKAGLKVALHCAEVYNPEETLEMIDFKPDRIGHAVCVHPRFKGTEETWSRLVESKIPVEVCMTSNVNTKSVPNYESHHFKELYEANVPIILCTDDKGVFMTSLTHEYTLCAETFGLTKEQLVRLALAACQYVFDESCKKDLNDKILNFIENNIKIYEY